MLSLERRGSKYRRKSNYFICDGDWQQFVVHHQLELGDILLFFLIDKSTFHVLAYNQKCYSNFSGSPLFEELSSSSEEKQDTSRNAKRVKTEPKESSEEEEVERKEENGSKEDQAQCGELKQQRSIL
ncbi:hypothetical protein HAX54_052193 [Datura stramonium]|uniref:TF-B3 domain-containing protein n=1 Tax=Datura stramonium TaxID=4076 RepID=A0ABS8WS12_DATST|nr:hypothetical protein [Datura stramonium]